ncbi:cytochrome c oxidase assembly protein [Tessaracoccus lacteus]|uniref:Cytochrome c oxidase assembly protein n=1 Tax=Tessaracoccus lacteus TaxID=3041766 RepID=A0ABY8PY96_9ACTN|nr:cytochrome c oxidase assembly protein [Tessaracoccus sp. T21]WGT47378.1 cytochrome c oxidase assembly protein [Tessaracoccus sp. T21]
MESRPRLPRRLSLAGLLAVVVAFALPVAFVLAAGAAPYEAIVRVFPGNAVAVTTTILQVIAELAGVITVGALVLVLFLRDATSKEAFQLKPGLDLAIARVAAPIWSLAAGLLIIFNALDTTGVPLSALGQAGALGYVFGAASNSGMTILRFGAAALVAVALTLARRWPTLLISLWASAIAILAPLVTGQVLVGPSHDLGGDAAVIQAVAVYPLLGVLAVLAIMAACGELPGPATWRRFVGCAAVAIPVVVIADGVVTWFKLAGTGLLASATGQLIVTRWVALAVLIAAVAWLSVARRRDTLQTAAPSALALALLAVGSWIALSVAMTREPPPQYFVPTSVQEVFLGFDVTAAPTWAVVATHWRLNLLFFAIAAVGVTLYLVGVRSANQRGVKWPVGRTVAWVLGWVVVVVATSSGIGKYSGPHFGIHMVMHMTLSMLVPVLLSMGGVVTLTLRASRSDAPVHSLHHWVSWLMRWGLTKFLYNPIVAFTLFISSYYGLYFTGLFDFLMRFHWGHQLMNLHFLVVGYLYYSLIIGVDRGPKPLPHIGKLGLAMAAMPFHAFFGVILMNTGSIIAKSYYEWLTLPWADLAAAQELGGGVAWVGGELPSLIVVIALGFQWAKQDRREAARKDRHYDSGLDTEYEDYNRMLERLAARDQEAKQ